jgi:hypothetical protein
MFTLRLRMPLLLKQWWLVWQGRMSLQGMLAERRRNFPGTQSIT